MNSNKLLRLLCVFLVVFVLSAVAFVAPPERARLYVDLCATPAKKTFDIISKAETQRDLHLTTNQIASIAASGLQQMKDIPVLAGLLGQKMASTNREERKKISTELWKCYDEYLLNSLSNILSAAQSKRLQEIARQVDGLKLLEHDHALAAALGLSDNQLAEVKHVFAVYEPAVGPLCQRLRRQMIPDVGTDETPQSRKVQAESLAGAITQIERERDLHLYAILTFTQKSTWRRLVGKPIQIHWNAQMF